MMTPQESERRIKRRKTARESMRKIRQNRLLNKLCFDCGGQRETKHFRCNACRERRREWERDARAKMKELTDA